MKGIILLIGIMGVSAMAQELTDEQKVHYCVMDIALKQVRMIRGCALEAEAIYEDTDGNIKMDVFKAALCMQNGSNVLKQVHKICKGHLDTYKESK